MMLLFKIGFLEITIADIFDILFFGILIFIIYRLLRGGLAYNILIGLFILYLLSLIVQTLNMNLMTKVLGQFTSIGVLALLIVFQPEIRRFLILLGRSRYSKFWRPFIPRNITDLKLIERQSKVIAQTVQSLCQTKTGALIVFIDPGDRSYFENTGVPIHGDISQKLLESIFQTKSPLHDGAVVITQNKILGAGCILPVSENQALPSRIGLRHRAAVGITELTNAIVLVVSEERGKASLTQKGKIIMNVSEQQLLEGIQQGLGVEYE